MIMTNKLLPVALIAALIGGSVGALVMNRSQSATAETTTPNTARTATPVATSSLGKPTPASNGDITVDRATFFSGLAAGNYLATVTAFGPGGQTQSSSVTFTR